MKKIKPRSGFTLIEILVVISIIGLLVAAGLASFTNSQKRARDTKRRADLKSIQTAMEQYYEDHSYAYPTNLNDLNSYFPNNAWPVGPKEESYTSGFTSNATSYSKAVVLESGPTVTIRNLQ